MNDINAVLAMMGDPEVAVWILIATIVLSLPPVFVLFSKRVSGGTKVTWFILTFDLQLARLRGLPVPSPGRKGTQTRKAGKASG